MQVEAEAKSARETLFLSSKWKWKWKWKWKRKWKWKWKWKVARGAQSELDDDEKWKLRICCGRPMVSCWSVVGGQLLVASLQLVGGGQLVKVRGS